MNTTRDIAGRVRHALEQAEHGEIEAFEGLSAPLATLGPDDGWLLAFKAASVFWGRGGREPEPTELEFLVDGPPEQRQGAARACVYLERLALLRFDAEKMSRLATLHTTLAAHDASPETRLAAESAVLWADILRGHPGDVERRCHALHKRAALAQSASTVIEATLQRALGAMAIGDSDAAVAHARRGSRMSRAEGLVAQEWLAHLVLARVRRAAGKPHLAAHILGALVPAVTSPWLGWLCWELVLAGRMDTALTLTSSLGTHGADDQAARAALHALDLLAAARQGDRARFDVAKADLSTALGGFVAIFDEATTLIGALDPRLPSTPLLSPWRHGKTLSVPLGLQGLPPWPEETNGPQTASRVDHALAFVAVEPGLPGRRVLRPGTALLDGGPEAEKEYGSRRAGQRTDVGLAVLALSGPAGMNTEEFFQLLWGFTFVPQLHQGALDAIAFTMRKLIDGRAELVRGKGHIALQVLRPLVLADPRCVRSTAEHVLQLLVRHGVIGAVDGAQSLGVSLRTIQMALKQLAADGVCRVERDGREIRYRVIDTTFTTLTGFNPS